jgi:rubrerythrin
MGLLDRLRSAISGPPLIGQLAILAGQSEALVNRLRRHAERAMYPGIAQGVREIAEKEAAHEKTLRAVLAQRRLWPRPPEEVPHEGSSNWERLSGDLEILLLFAQELHRHAMRWEGEHPELGETLKKIADEASDNEFRLRRLVAKLDPQALD